MNRRTRVCLFDNFKCQQSNLWSFTDSSWILRFAYVKSITLDMRFIYVFLPNFERTGRWRNTEIVGSILGLLWLFSVIVIDAIKLIFRLVELIKAKMFPSLINTISRRPNALKCYFEVTRRRVDKSVTRHSLTWLLCLTVLGSNPWLGTFFVKQSQLSIIRLVWAGFL